MIQNIAYLNILELLEVEDGMCGHSRTLLYLENSNGCARILDKNDLNQTHTI